MIEAVFPNGVDEITAHGLTQWDKGRKLKITLSSLPASFEVHFATKRSETAYVVDAVASGGIATVNIPNAILRQPMDATAWVYFVNDDAGETVKTIHLPVERRAKPADYTYDEAEIANFRQVINQRMDDYLAAGAILSGATLEEAAQIERNTADIEKNEAQIAELREFTLERTGFEHTGGMVQIDTFSGCPLECVTHIEPVQAGSGDASPDNIRAITGLTSITLTRCGKNLLDSKTYRERTNNTVVDISDNLTRIYTTGGRIWAGVAYSFFDLKKGVTYRFSLDLVSYTSGRMTFCVRNEASKILKSVVGTTPGHYTFEYTPTDDITVFPSIMVTNGDTITMGDITFSNIQMEIGDAFTEYEPYQGDTFTVNFGQTICSGSVDWNTGVLTIDQKLLVFDGTESFIRLSDMTNQKQSNVFILSPMDSARILWADSKCSHFRNVREAIWAEKFDGVVGVCCDNASSSNVYYNKYFRWGNGSNTVDDWKAYLAAQYAAGTPVQLCYELAEPITIQLTAHDIYALQGVNKVWCDAGEMTVSGRKDIMWVTEYLTRKIAELQNAIISLGGNV